MIQVIGRVADIMEKLSSGGTFPLENLWKRPSESWYILCNLEIPDQGGMGAKMWVGQLLCHGLFPRAWQHPTMGPCIDFLSESDAAGAFRANPGISGHQYVAIQHSGDYV